MASVAKIEPVEAVLQIDPLDIDTSKCIGLVFPEWEEALGKLIKADGQRQPVGVISNGPRASKPWTLTFGRHRVGGILREQLPFVRAIIDEGGEASQASENVDRRHLGPIEHALFVRSIADAAEARVKREHGDFSPQEIGIRKRWDAMNAKAKGVEREDELADADAEHSRLNLSRLYGWREETAEILGMSLASLKRTLSLYRSIIAPFPDLYADLARHPIVGDNASALREIASYAEPSRRAIIEGLIEAPDMTLAQALEGLALKAGKAPAPTGATKYQDNAGANIARLSLSDQRSWAPAFAKAVKPQALRDFITACEERAKELGV